MISPGTETRLVGLLGSPLGHSLSPRMHNRVFEKLQMDCLYLPIEVSREDLPTVFAAIKKMNFIGCNVTIPHKLEIIDLLDELDPLAQRIGAVNTVQLTNGRAVGYNTDGPGFLRSLAEEAGITPQGRRFLLFGCGGATRAIAITLATEGAAAVTICNRTVGKAERLAEEINSRISRCAQAIAFSDKEQQSAAEEAEIIINTTSIGMSPDREAIPCPPAIISAHHVVADIVYNPPQTTLLSAAEERGAKVVPGLGMLVWQGAAAFEIFTGRKADVAIMKEEVNRLRTAQ